jgi:hypothetical protein
VEEENIKKENTRKVGKQREDVKYQNVINVLSVLSVVR